MDAGAHGGVGWALWAARDRALLLLLLLLLPHFARADAATYAAGRRRRRTAPAAPKLGARTSPCMAPGLTPLGPVAPAPARTRLVAAQVPLYAVNQYIVFDHFKALDIGGGVGTGARVLACRRLRGMW